MSLYPPCELVVNDNVLNGIAVDLFLLRSGVRVSRIAFEVGGSASRTTNAKLAIIQYSVSRMLGKPKHAEASCSI